MDVKVDPFANCVLCLPLKVKYDLVLEGFPLCEIHAKEVISEVLFGDSDED